MILVVAGPPTGGLAAPREYTLAWLTGWLLRGAMVSLAASFIFMWARSARRAEVFG